MWSESLTVEVFSAGCVVSGNGAWLLGNWIKLGRYPEWGAGCWPLIAAVTVVAVVTELDWYDFANDRMGSFTASHSRTNLLC